MTKIFTGVSLIAIALSFAACGPEGPGFAGGGGRYALSPQAQYQAEQAERASTNHYRWPHPDRSVGWKKGDAHLMIKKRPTSPMPASRDANNDPGAVY